MGAASGPSITPFLESKHIDIIKLSAPEMPSAFELDKGLMSSIKSTDCQQ